MKLPLTIATFRGILIRIGENMFLFPVNMVERVSRLKMSELLQMDNCGAIEYEGHNIPVLWLEEILGFTVPKHKKVKDKGLLYIVIVPSGLRYTAFPVDEIFGEEEGIMKSLGPQLKKVPGITGATLLATGKIVPVLDIGELLEIARTKTVSMKSNVGPESGQDEVKNVRILIAEDSLTSRALLRNLVEMAGYEAITVADGWDAYTLLKQSDFDLVVSDVEMPRMNGFELTTRIRKDIKLNRIPIILVTALESAVDKQRGLEAGANAYIVKSSFEESNLISTIQRLI